MPLSEASLDAQRDALVAQIASIIANPKPTYTVAGRTFQWTQLLAELRQQVATINGLIDIIPAQTKSEVWS